MNKYLFIYTLFLVAFAVYLAAIGVVWFSAVVLILSFMAYAILVGQVIRKSKEDPGV